MPTELSSIIDEELAEFLDRSCSVPILLIDEQQQIKDCNNGFLKLFSLSQKPIGATLADFLIAGDEGVVFERKLQQFLCNPQTGVRSVLVANCLPQKEGLLLWCERPFQTNNQVVEQIALLNSELITLQRELAKQNHDLIQVKNKLAEKVVQLESTLLYVKRLEGILPVCIYCNNIRDDTGTDPGKGKWMRMEEFLYHKSGTTISHGCCPECFEAHIDDD